jgi:hypothetical protein
MLHIAEFFPNKFEKLCAMQHSADELSTMQHGAEYFRVLIEGLGAVNVIEEKKLRSKIS